MLDSLTIEKQASDG